ncbi:MAG TPA: hypothetical protein VEM13_08530 [Gemmatimonadales bacterium]|nr:hypothetical protein [Gemmatimonadales bacterium]
MAEAKVAGSIPTQEAASQTAPQKEKQAVVSDRPSKVLPTNRIAFSKQLEILRGFAALGAQGVSAPTNPAVADLVGLNRSTTLLALPFFVDVGLLTKSGDGYVPAQEVLAYGKAHSWNADTAPQKLTPIFRRAWFAQAILTRLALGTVEEKKALEVLGVACGAEPKYEPQLKTLLQYLAVTGLMRRDGDTIRAPEAGIDEPAETNGGDPATTTKEVTPSKEGARAAAIATAFAHIPEGRLRISVDLDLDVREFASWRPERTNAFFSGIAQVLAAKAAVEAKSSG